MRSCYVCGCHRLARRPGRLRDAPEVGLVACEACGLIVHASDLPRGLVDYEAGSMHDQSLPTLCQWRDQSAPDDSRRAAAVQALDPEGAVLDIGFGAGGFLMRMADAEHDVLGVELESRARDELLALGIPAYETTGKIPLEEMQGVGTVTMFHVLEHMADPRSFIHGLQSRIGQPVRLVTEVPSADDPLLALYVSSAFSEFTFWSHHEHLHTYRSLERLLVDVVDDLQITRFQRYGLANHLWWLSHGQPGGDPNLPWLSGNDLDVAYRRAITEAGFSDTLWAVGTLQPIE